MSRAATAQLEPGHYAATRAVFFISGTGLASWAPMVPYAKTRLGIGDAALGSLLLCLGVGAVIAMPSSQRLVARLGCRTVILGSIGLLVAMLPLMATLHQPVAMAAALLLFGAAMGVLDVTMNVHATLVEKLGGERMMSHFHAWFSVGGIAGAVIGAELFSIGLSPLPVALIVLAFLGGLTAWFGRSLLPDGSTGSSTRFTLPRGAVLVMAIIAFAAFLVEGGMLDWSALFLTTSKNFPQSRSGFGYAVFAAAMTLARWTGDGITNRIGVRATMSLGAVLGCAGLLLASIAGSASVVVLGFALAGLGIANIAPLDFAESGRQDSMAPAAAISVLTTLGYAGSLAGPAAIGMTAHAFGLRVSFMILAGLLALVALVGRWLV